MGSEVPNHEERQEPLEDEIAPLPVGIQSINSNAAGTDDKDWQYFNLLSLGDPAYAPLICSN